MTASRSRAYVRLLVAGSLVAAYLSGAVAPAGAVLPTTPNLTLHHTLQASPFVGSSVSAEDNEGSAYVPRDDSLWLVDDDAQSIYEVNATTGALKRTIDDSVLSGVRQLGGTASAGTSRSEDLESLAYDEVNDVLYAFSGTCCSSSVRSAAYRFTRAAGRLEVESFQALDDLDFTAAAWNPGDGMLYTGIDDELRTYDYAANTVGALVGLNGVDDILGMDFTNDGKDLFVARYGTTVTRVDWATKREVAGWSFDLAPLGLLDTRAVEVVGDQLWVSDGYDYRSSGDPLSHAVFVLDLGGSTAPPSAPSASFSVSTSSGVAPLPVAFTDTSSGGAPTSWLWDFGDGSVAATARPHHTYADAGSYTVRLTVSNAGGASTASRQVTVSAPPEPPEPPTPPTPPTPPPPPTPDPPVPPTPDPPIPPSTTPPAPIEYVRVNLLRNPGFESSRRGWNDAGKAGVRLKRVRGGHTGTWAVRVQRSRGTRTLILNDKRDPASTSQASVYTAGLWVRGRPGDVLRLRLRENLTGTKVGQTATRVTLTRRWQRVTVSLAVRAPGRSTIDVAALLRSGAKRAWFEADDAELVES